MKQQTLMGFEKFGKIAHRAQCLAEMDRIMPWAELAAAIEPVHPKGRGAIGGRLSRNHLASASGVID